jgi:hypothetical protein
MQKCSLAFSLIAITNEPQMICEIWHGESVRLCWLYLDNFMQTTYVGNKLFINIK